MRKGHIALSLIVAATLAIAAGVAVAGDAGTEQPTTVAVERSPLASFNELPALQSGDTLAQHRDEQAQLRTQVTEAPNELLLSDLDLRTARAIGANGIARDDAWVIATRAGDGICVLTRQFGSTNPTAFSSACGSLAEFNANGVTVLKPGPGGKALLVSIQGPDVPMATIKNASGETKSVDNSAGTTVVLVDRTSSVNVGGFSSSARFAFE